MKRPYIWHVRHTWCFRHVFKSGDIDINNGKILFLYLKMLWLSSGIMPYTCIRIFKNCWQFHAVKIDHYVFDLSTPSLTVLVTCFWIKATSCKRLFYDLCMWAFSHQISACLQRILTAARGLGPRLK